MAASFMTLTGTPKAVSQSNSTHPVPRFQGSSTTSPRMTGLGMPIVMASKVQPAVLAWTPATTCGGVKPSPESNLRTSGPPECISLTWVPPTSMTKTRMLVE